MVKKINLYIDEELFEWIEEVAKREDRSLNKVCKMLLEFMKENPQYLGLKNNGNVREQPEL